MIVRREDVAGGAAGGREVPPRWSRAARVMEDKNNGWSSGWARTAELVRRHMEEVGGRALREREAVAGAVRVGG